MDCNKEEALRAKAIAEKKMQSKDFVGARKIALKAQQLYSDVENISQMLMVCDVHCSAEKKLLGGEMDWYGILQLEMSADEATIKKQYRRFALQLHPDKNKFAGAEGAFKLIGEAQRILLDGEKRKLHDFRRGGGVRPSMQYRPQANANWTSNVARNTSRSNPSGVNSQNQQSRQPAQPGYAGSQPTFWTACPFCSVRYQYYREFINRSLRCQSCSRPFVAYDMEAPTTADFTRPVFPNQMNNAQNVEAQSQKNFGTGNLRAKPVQNAGKNVGRSSTAGTGKVNQKREKKRARDQCELSDSEISDEISSDSDSEEDIEIDENGDLQGGRTSGYSGEESVRRSSRRKQKVSYTEKFSDYEDDDNFEKNPVEKAKRKKRSSFSTDEENGKASKEESAKMKNQFYFSANNKEDEKEVKQKEADEECLQNGEKNTDSSSEDAPDSLFSYPDPDFNDFDKDRNAGLFEAGQIWAAYDDLNAMPRFYARIKKVLSPGFKVQMTWLEPDPDDENEIKWQSGELPFSCGKFKCGRTEKTDNLPMFSHRIACEKGIDRDTFLIYPRFGETWALFKDWDIKWNRDPATYRVKECEYEVVEILSNYTKGVGIHVALLRKVKGFVSLFCRTEEVGRKTFIVPPGELLRFSHMIPSYKMKGNEREGVATGSLELDPASLPIKLLSSSVFDPEVKPDMKRSHSQPQQNSYGVHSALTPEPMEVPEPIFYNFDADKAKEKFQVGQIWALYSDEDGMPKYYGQIRKIDVSPAFGLRVSWLGSCYPSENFIGRSKDKMPIGCGRFKLKKSEYQTYDCSDSFSHLVRAEPAGRKNEYNILPRTGEVWALYRNWSADVKDSDLRNCDYDIVEVLEANDSQTDALVLCRVDGFSSVFKPQVQEGSTIGKSIPHTELLKFSHQIPAFRLSEEIGGMLRGCWELDPAAMPVQHFCSRS